MCGDETARVRGCGQRLTICVCSERLKVGASQMGEVAMDCVCRLCVHHLIYFLNECGWMRMATECKIGDGGLVCTVWCYIGACAVRLSTPGSSTLHQETRCFGNAAKVA